MLSITHEEFMRFNPCWDEDDVKAISKGQERWTAMDILNLPEEDVSSDDKLWAVLREELIPAPILHEFACRCAEGALALCENPDPRSVAAIEAKRAWVRGEISDDELRAARFAARSAAQLGASEAADEMPGFAARAAAHHAARITTNTPQVKMLVEMLRESDAKESK